MYYKYTTIVNYTSSIFNKLEALLTDDTRVIIYDRHVFIVQAAEQSSNIHSTYLQLEQLRQRSIK
jgi:hypothetical protein